MLDSIWMLYNPGWQWWSPHLWEQWPAHSDWSNQLRTGRMWQCKTSRCVTLQYQYNIKWHFFQEEYPYGVFARISHYRKWIESKMSNPVFCSGTASANTVFKRHYSWLQIIYCDLKIPKIFKLAAIANKGQGYIALIYTINVQGV